MAELVSEAETKRPPGRLKVNILKWHAVARWTWGDDVDGDVCGICQMPFEGCPPGVLYPGDGAPVVWGKCGHAFHLQCVSQWLSSKNSCPICRREWEFESNSAVTAANAAPAPAAAAPVVKAEPGLNGAEPMATDEPKKDDDKMDES